MAEDKMTSDEMIEAVRGHIRRTNELAEMLSVRGWRVTFEIGHLPGKQVVRGNAIRELC